MHLCRYGPHQIIFTKHLLISVSTASLRSTKSERRAGQHHEAGSRHTPQSSQIPSEDRTFVATVGWPWNANSKPNFRGHVNHIILPITVFIEASNHFFSPLKQRKNWHFWIWQGTRLLYVKKVPCFKSNVTERKGRNQLERPPNAACHIPQIHFRYEKLPSSHPTRKFVLVLLLFYTIRWTMHNARLEWYNAIQSDEKFQHTASVPKNGN